jgi:hypothetical protein
MYNFLVGGFLPGTNIQLSFQAWLITMAIIVAIAVLIWKVYKAHQETVNEYLKSHLGLYSSRLLVQIRLAAQLIDHKVLARLLKTFAER